MSAIEQMVKDNMGLAFHQLHRFNLAYDEDAISYALEALFKAADTYDSDNSTAFSTYATACIYNGIQQYIRSVNRKRIQVTPLDTFTYDNGEVWIPSESFKYKSAEDEAIDITIDDIYKLVCSVVDTFKYNRTTYECIKLWVESDFTLKTVDIAPLVGCSQPTASRAIKAFRNKLKEELKNVKS